VKEMKTYRFVNWFLGVKGVWHISADSSSEARVLYKKWKDRADRKEAIPMLVRLPMISSPVDPFLFRGTSYRGEI
jgi:hypothetical protein